MLAGALSYRLFVFLLPLAFFIVSGIGLLGDAIGKDPRLIANSVGFASVVTGEVASTAKSTSNWWVALTSFFALVYATRVLCRAVAIVHSLAWERTASSVKVTSHMLTVFASVVLGQIVFAAGVGAVGHQTVVGGIFVALLGVFVVAVLWLVVSLNLPHSSAGWTDLIPGSVWYGVGLLCIQGFNVLVLGSLLAVEVDHLRRARNRRHASAGPLLRRTGDRRGRSPQRDPLQTQDAQSRVDVTRTVHPGEHPGRGDAGTPVAQARGTRD